MQLLTKNQVWSLHKKCQLLIFALTVAKVKMPIFQNWDVEKGWQMGVKLSKCSWTLYN